MRLAPVSLALACAIASGKEITLFYITTCTFNGTSENGIRSYRTRPDYGTGWYVPDEVKTTYKTT